MSQDSSSPCRRRLRGTRRMGAVAAMGVAATACAAQAAPFDKQALIEALDDEYRAEATYLSVIEKFGEVRPFINIVRAEQRHADMIKAQFERFGMDVPDNTHIGRIEAPESLLAACKAGVKAEIENIALYDEILPKVSDPGVRATLSRLQAASRDNHLPAFERCVARGGTPGGGPGGGRGPGGGWR